MNVYNEAHNLARAIRESEEYKQYEAAKRTVTSNPELTRMLNDFQAKQFDLQAKLMLGEGVPPEINGQIQELYNIMMKDPVSAHYFQCEVRFSVMMNDVYKILGEIMGVSLPAQFQQDG
jgi:cell fate (sporulation/competence/biofilm development) regulator YlbF (YheA/YmcA/DUF963 family)